MEKTPLDIEKEIKELISSLDINKKSIDKLIEVQHTHDNLEKLILTLISNITELISQTKSLKSSIDILHSTTENHTISTRVINAFGINSNNNYTIIKKKGFGKIRELKIISKSKYNLYIKVDKTEIFNTNSSFDNLKLISKGLKNIICNEESDDKGNKLFTITIKNIKFIEYIEAAINFSGSIIINNIFCIYDIKEI